MKKRVIIIVSVILVITLIIVGLVIYNNNKIEQELNEAQELYLVYLSGPGFLGNKNKFQFYNENGELIKEEKISGDSINFEYINDNIIYFGGPGGLYEFNVNDLNLQRISKDKISIVKFYNDEMYYYASNKNTICYGDSCLEADMLVGDFVVNDDYLYVLGSKLKIYQNDELIEEYDYSDERIITKIYNLNGKMLIINEFDILSINGTEVTMLDNIHDEETLLYYQDENGDNYIFDIDNQILMSVDLKDDYSYEVKEELDITNLIQSSYDFINNVETFYGLDTNNNVMIMDSDNNTIKQFELNMKSNDLVYGVYRVK